MLVVGLTGGIATGKSTVSTQLKGLGFPVVDADVLARKVVEPGTPALRRIVSTFGAGVLQSDGTLDRKALGEIIFRDEAKRRALNAIVHPAVRRAMLWEIVQAWLRGHRVCIVDVPLLVESNLWRLVGRVVVVYCSRDVQLQRLMKRDGSTEEQATHRLNSQMLIDDKVAYADDIVDNSGQPEETKVQVVRLARKLDLATGYTWRLNWLLPPLGVIAALFCLLRRRLMIKTPTLNTSSR
ncbi:CoaE-domain-containing protein [Exidia glandulosa HHB12029]|uniref:CoaE-domain-containing protein n=1 Tax=Exidia glandulosa HHB12029 TaxID=1314781 RepID=A0A165I4C1_EXIGL|nr:CoaE-domain-containing protein [Exidia glandulosa HHB12029]